jgi:hypothetical protein
MTGLGKTYADALNGRDLVPEALGLLPNVLPYLAEGRPERSFDVPEELKHRVRFRGALDGVTLLDETLDLGEVMGRRLTLSYVPFDEDDARTVAEFGGLTKTPPYLVEVKPVLKSGGVTVAAGEGAIGAGVLFELRIELVHPGAPKSSRTRSWPQPHLRSGSRPRRHGQEAGSSHAAAILAGWPGPTSRAGTAPTPSWASSSAWSRCDHGVRLHGHVDVEVEYAEAILYPVTFDWKGRSTPTCARARRSGSRTGAERDFLLLTGLEGGVLEGRVLEDVLGVESVSTAEVLQLAAAAGVPVLELVRDNVDDELVRITLDPVVEEEVRNGAWRGFTVRLPEEPVTRLAWTGVGYRILDTTTGEAAYQLHGGHSGGVTAPSTFEWPSGLRDTLVDQGEEPAPEGAEVASIAKFLSTDFQEGFVDEPLERPFRVLVTDEQGQRVARATVTFAVLGGDGELIDPVSGSPAGSQVTALSNDRAGRGEAPPRQEHVPDPRFACFEPSGCSTETESYATQVGLNVVTAYAGPAILSEPFYAYSKPDDRHPDGGRGAYLNITTGFDRPGVHNLRVITLLNVYASDQFRNPISNFGIRFAYKGPPIGDPPPGYERARPVTEDPGALLKLRDYKACSDRTIVVRKGECAGEAPEQVVPSAVDGAPVYPIAGDSTYSSYLFDVGTPLTPEVFGAELRHLGDDLPVLRRRRAPAPHLSRGLDAALPRQPRRPAHRGVPAGERGPGRLRHRRRLRGLRPQRVRGRRGRDPLPRGRRQHVDASRPRGLRHHPRSRDAGHLVLRRREPDRERLYEGTMTLSETPQLNTVGWEFRLVPEEIPLRPRPGQVARRRSTLRRPGRGHGRQAEVPDRRASAAAVSACGASSRPCRR